MTQETKTNLLENTRDPFVNFLGKIILFFVRILSVLMVLVILWAMVDVIYHVYNQFVTSKEELFASESLFGTLGSILVVLIAIEIFLNIVFFLIEDDINVPLVLATALTAIARKVIILDYAISSTEQMYGMAGLIFATGLVYWLLSRKNSSTLT